MDTDCWRLVLPFRCESIAAHWEIEASKTTAWPLVKQQKKQCTFWRHHKSQGSWQAAQLCCKGRLKLPPPSLLRCPLAVSGERSGTQEHVGSLCLFPLSALISRRAGWAAAVTAKTQYCAFVAFRRRDDKVRAKTPHDPHARELERGWDASKCSREVCLFEF